MTYEELQFENATINIQEIRLSDVRGLKGLYVNGNIAIDSDMTSCEKACVLAEELGHHHTSVGNILDQSSVSNRKQERRARLWAYNKMIGLCGIVRCYQSCCRNRYEMAELLDVTEDFLQEALDYYSDKYGDHAVIDNYIIYFQPTITVLELI